MKFGTLHAITRQVRVRKGGVLLNSLALREHAGRRIAKLESALLQLRESTVLAYERMIAEDT